jgi:hypothetical protein
MACRIEDLLAQFFGDFDCSKTLTALLWKIASRAPFIIASMLSLQHNTCCQRNINLPGELSDMFCALNGATR